MRSASPCRAVETNTPPLPLSSLASRVHALHVSVLHVSTLMLLGSVLYLSAISLADGGRPFPLLLACSTRTCCSSPMTGACWRPNAPLQLRW